jgi:hypothetical protein
MKTGIAYIGVRDPHFVKQDMEYLASAGYTDVCHTYSEEDFKYYRDTMRDIVQISVEAGLNVYVTPFAIGKVFNGEGLSEQAGTHPEQAQVDSMGNSVAASCFNAPSFQKYMREWVEEVCSLDVEAILWDNPHFYKNADGWCCQCKMCQKLFRKTYEHLMPNSLTDTVKEFRWNSIYQFLSEMTGLVRRNGKRNAVCIELGEKEEGFKKLELLAELPTVDELSLKPYWEKGEKPAVISKSYHRYGKKLLALSEKYEKSVQIWIKNFSIEKNNEESVSEATYAAYNEGIRNIFAWAVRGTGGMGMYRSDDPECVWKLQTEAFAECQEKAILNEMVHLIRSNNPENEKA